MKLQLKELDPTFETMRIIREGIDVDKMNNYSHDRSWALQCINAYNLIIQEFGYVKGTYFKRMHIKFIHSYEVVRQFIINLSDADKYIEKAKLKNLELHLK